MCEFRCYQQFLSLESMSQPSIEQEYSFKINILPSPPQLQPQPKPSHQPNTQQDPQTNHNPLQQSQKSQDEAWQEVYYSKVNQFYKAVESLKQKSSARRIRPEVTQYLFYMTSQILIMLLKYLILNDRDSHHYHTYVELFTITVFAGFVYFYAVETFQLGLGTLLQVQFHLDQIQLCCVICMMVGQHFVGLLGMDTEHSLAFRIAYPLWVFYQGSTVRIQVSMYRCNRFQTLSTKLLLLSEFVLTLITLVRYSVGGVSHELVGQGRMVSYLFLLAHAVGTAQYYKLYSQFDGTNCMRYDFLFENSLEAKIRTQIKHLKKKLLDVEPRKYH